MSTAVDSLETRAAADPRLAAFLEPDCPEVFHSVATPSAIWKPDPFDVETIHPEARAAFEYLLNRAGRTPPPPSGAVLVLLGEAGSGKTHLMRAFRTRAHGCDLGYCGYLQMTAEAGNYARYMLTNLIDGLEQPYDATGPSRTGLARLSAALLESVPGLSGMEMEAFRESESGDDPAGLADDYADRLQTAPRFRDCGLELLRVLLHLQRNEPRVRSRALMWLRCENMRSQDREWIGEAVPRTDDADPMKMLQQLAKLTDAVHGVPLVLLIDQLEDMANQSAPVDRFLKVIDAITAFTDAVPNTIIVLACLEDYFRANIEKLNKAKQDRLLRDPDPIRLLGNRTSDEIREMTARRLAHLYDTADVLVDPANELYPFRDDHLARLNNLRARDALDFLRRHHQHCLTIGRWEDPGGTISTSEASPENELDPLWNDFHSSFQATVPDGEEDLSQILADAIRGASAELPDGYQFSSERDGRYLEVETHRPSNEVDKLLVAVCNAGTRGPNFVKQLAELEKRAGEIPVAIVRTTDFPKTGKATNQIAVMLKRHGRTVVVVDTDWRRMLAFGRFRASHASRTDFAAWQNTARPLGELDSLRKILNFSALAAMPARAAASQPPAAPPVRVVPVSATSEDSITPSAPRGSDRSRPHEQRDAVPRHLRAERVRPARGIPRWVGQRQDDGGAEPDRAIARARRSGRAARSEGGSVPVRRSKGLGSSAWRRGMYRRASGITEQARRGTLHSGRAGRQAACPAYRAARLRRSSRSRPGAVCSVRRRRAGQHDRFQVVRRRQGTAGDSGEGHRDDRGGGRRGDHVAGLESCDRESGWSALERHRRRLPWQVLRQPRPALADARAE